MKILEADGLVVVKQGRRLLDGVSLRVKAGEFVGIVGPNGSGKTTLLRVLCSLEPPADGGVTLDGESVQGLPSATRARRIGYHPQDPQLHWPLPVRTLVALGRLPHGGSPGALTAEDLAELDNAFALTNLHPLLDRHADTLSGGELARVHIARLLAGRHELLLADEPIANLDPRFQLDILSVLRAYVDRQHATIAVLHDLATAARYCDRVVVLRDGRVHCEGAPREVLSANVVSAVFGVPATYCRDAGIEHALAVRANHDGLR